MKHFIVTLLVGFWLLGPHAFADVNAKNGISITTASTINGKTPNSAFNGLTIVSGGGGGPALIAELGEGAASGGDGFTTAAITTTGANLIAVAKFWYGASEPALSDSKGNTYTATTIRATAADTRWVRWYYVYGGTVGSGHTFTVGGTAHYASLAVLAFSGTASSPLDQEASGEDTAWTSISSGSITPSQANTISLTALMHDSGSGTLTAPSTWTAAPISSPSGGAHLGGAAAWKVLTSTSAINPAWSSDTSYLFGVVSHITIKY